MNVKRVLLCGGAALALALAGCSLLGVSIDDRLAKFQDDLNNPDRSGAYLEFDSSLTSYYTAVKKPEWWDIPFPIPAAGEQQYLITVSDESKSSKVTATISGPPTFSATGPRDAVFVMSQENGDYFIEKIFLDGSTTATIKELR
jgi:hypothetical protein